MSDASHKDTVELDRFIVNERTHEVHHVNCATHSCQLGEIERPIAVGSLADARKKHGADLCAYCFRSKE